MPSFPKEVALAEEPAARQSVVGFLRNVNRKSTAVTQDDLPPNPICERSGGCAKACEAWDAANDLYPTSGYYPNECEDACEAWETGVDYASNAFQPCWCEEGFSPNSYSGWAC